jgi:outer membrane receptor for ferrienterochelin and colicins
MGFLSKAVGTAVLLLVFCASIPAQETLHQLEDITVTGTRGEKRLKDSPVATEVITAEEIENSSASTVTEILEDYGIMFTGNAMGDYIQLQGMGEGRILYLIDGRKVVGRISQRLNGDTIPLSNVERIEIVRGPQSALYGSDGIGGVINIITKKPEDSFSLSASLSNSFLFAHDDPDTDKKPAALKNFDPFREQHFNAQIGIPIAVTRNSISLEGSRGALYLNEKENASLLPGYYRGKVGLDTAFPLGEGELSAGGSFMAMRSDEQTNAAGSLTRRSYIRADGYVEAELFPLNSGALTLRLYNNYYRRDMDNYYASLNNWITGERHEYENITALEAVGTYDGVDHFIFTAGIEGAYNFIDKYNLHNGASSFAAIDKEALYFQAEYFKEDRYSIIAGVRGERNSQFGFGGAPKLSAMFHLPGGFRLLGGAGVGYRAPDFTDLYMLMDDSVVQGHPTVKGNENLKPEYAVSFNLALEYSKEDLCFAQINGYYTELFDEIVQIGRPGTNVYESDNVARSMRTGFDSEGRLLLFTNFFLSAGYSWVYAYDRSEGEELHVQPAHTVKGKLGWDHKKSGIHTYFQGRFFSPLDSDDSDDNSRFILDFYFSVSFADHFKVHASVDNLTGLIDPLGPVVGRVFTLGLKYAL